MHDAARVCDQSGRIGGDKHFALAHPQHDWSTIARRDDRVRPLCIHHDKGIGTGNEAECLPYRVGKGLSWHCRDQVWKHLRICIRTEGDAFRDEPGSKGGGILDNPIVDHRDAIGGIAVRMRVSVARFAMRSPARVRDPRRSPEAVRYIVLKIANPALALCEANDGDPG